MIKWEEVKRNRKRGGNELGRKDKMNKGNMGQKEERRAGEGERKCETRAGESRKQRRVDGSRKRAEQIIYPQGREVRRFLLTQLHLCVFVQDVVHMVTWTLSFLGCQREMLSSKDIWHSGSQNTGAEPFWGVRYFYATKKCRQFWWQSGTGMFYLIGWLVSCSFQTFFKRTSTLWTDWTSMCFSSLIFCLACFICFNPVVFVQMFKYFWW